jgi:para-aminobenzoate synthetase/4-amino-4-deoxychorismate lyase
MTDRPRPQAPTVLLAFPDMVDSGGARAMRPPLTIRAASRAEQVPALLDQVDRWAAEGLHVAGWVSYEAAPAFDEAMRVRAPHAGDPPIAWFAAARTLEEVALPPPLAAPPTEWVPDESRERHREAVDEIRERIGRGDVYQVNYTTRLRTTTPEDPIAMLARLTSVQHGSYAALFDIGSHRIISVSPELFFARDRERITTRPMKGTAPRGRWPDEDQRLARALAGSEKERAENVMIVDLLRNDLGRIARPGSVQVTRLFDVERYDTVWQLTSTIEASIPPETTLGDCFTALFPCGSVTGAPKVAAMAAIAELESAPRGPYCGAIGYVAPGGRATFSVAIRTLVQDAAPGHSTYGAGGGITWDSRPDAEYDEMLAKGRVLTRTRGAFALLETMRLEEGVVARRERHLARVEASARYFGFVVPRCAGDALDRAARETPRGTFRLRLVASRDGEVQVERQRWMPEQTALPAVVALASGPIRSDDPLYFHKTTAREAYERFRGEAPDAFDVLLWNERRQATELTIGNLVVELDGELLTPGRECGLLAGVFRQELLDRGTIRESVIALDRLPRASRLWLVNSLREWVPIRLRDEAAR